MCLDACVRLAQLTGEPAAHGMGPWATFPSTQWQDTKLQILALALERFLYVLNVEPVIKELFMGEQECWGGGSLFHSFIYFIPAE